MPKRGGGKGGHGGRRSVLPVGWRAQQVHKRRGPPVGRTVPAKTRGRPRPKPGGGWGARARGGYTGLRELDVEYLPPGPAKLVRVDQRVPYVGEHNQDDWRPASPNTGRMRPTRKRASKKPGSAKTGRVKGKDRESPRRPPLTPQESHGVWAGSRINNLGVVKWVNPDRGYGFISTIGLGYGFISAVGLERDIFFHKTAIRGIGLQKLASGQKVLFDVVSGKRGGASDECAVNTESC